MQPRELMHFLYMTYLWYESKRGTFNVSEKNENHFIYHSYFVQLNVFFYFFCNFIYNKPQKALTLSISTLLFPISLPTYQTKCS